ncbi:DUF4232 domain-containing protein [Streptomyces sp. NPDC021098]|uniref:DUF4232 domain-containing protein n=1 Tax=unclassified Streptomyces TaxID=2593676 RepID=UPI003793A16B
MNTNTTARTARRRTLRVAIAALTVAAGLSLTACSGSGDTGAKSAATAESGGKGSDTKVDAGDLSNKAGKAASGIERCHTSGLKAAFATGDDAVPDPNAEGGTTTSVMLTNKGRSTCKIGGFPGVDLKSVNGGERWSLQRSSTKYGSITLAPGDSTDFTINLAMTDEDEGFYQPAYAEITPPNETKSITLKWPWGTLVDQRSATHPGTFVNPIG